MNAIKPVRGELIDFSEVARRIKLSRGWIYSCIKKKCLPFDYLEPTPGKRFCDSADIDDFLIRSRIPAGDGRDQIKIKAERR